MRWLTIILAVFTSLLIGCRDVEYRAGRDTIQSFGDGRYQVLRISEHQVLYDLQRQEEVLRGVTNWLKSNEEIILMAGSQGPFVILHLNSNIAEKFLDIEMAPVRLQPLFNSLVK